MKIEYRRDIDGLRAIAVLGVVFYHFGFSFFGSGYAGVDIFFVISGFLIGGIILDEGRTGTFTFRTFYMRRARRILPALFVMMLVTIPFGFMIMSPGVLKMTCPQTRGTVSLLIRAAVSGRTPRHHSNASAACSASMPTPSARRVTPACCASLRKGVRPLP